MEHRWHEPVDVLGRIGRLLRWWLNVDLYLASMVFGEITEIYLGLLILDIDLRELALGASQVLLLQLLDFHLTRVDDILFLLQFLLQLLLFHQ
jgi:hypothetical protein